MIESAIALPPNNRDAQRFQADLTSVTYAFEIFIRPAQTFIPAGLRRANRLLWQCEVQFLVARPLREGSETKRKYRQRIASLAVESSESSAKTYFMFSALPARLQRELHLLGEKYHRRGLDLFVFGSFARGDNRPNSDLDLGMEWQGHPAPSILRQMEAEIEELPTVRKIDLVDFSRTSPQWRSIAGRDRYFLFAR